MVAVPDWTPNALPEIAGRVWSRNVAEGVVVKVFVTGATGVLCRVAVRALLDDGHQVTGLARGVDKTRSREADGARLMSVTRALEPAALEESNAASFASASREAAVLRFGTIVGDDLAPRWMMRRAQTGRRSASGRARTGHTSCTPRTLHEMTGSKPAHPVFEPQWIRAHSPR